MTKLNAIFILLLVFLASCALTRRDRGIFADIASPSKEREELLGHVSFMGESYLAASTTNLHILLADEERYLESVVQKIRMSNELIFKQSRPILFFIINSFYPCYFSLPSGKIVLSSALFKKYLKQEQLLVAVIAFELFRIEMRTYPTKMMIPTAPPTLERLLEHLALKTDVKINFYEWTAHIMKKAGYDPYAELMLLQIQNKNSLDFSIMASDARTFSKEESAFKSFLIKEGLDFSKGLDEENSSDPFYRLVKRLKQL